MGIRISEVEGFVDYHVSLPHFIEKKDEVWHGEVIVFYLSEEQRTGNGPFFKLEQMNCVPGSCDTRIHY